MRERYNDHIKGAMCMAPAFALCLAGLCALVLIPIYALWADLSPKQATMLVFVFAFGGAILGAVLGATATEIDKRRGDFVPW